MLLLKLFIEAVLLLIFIQDSRERSVYWFLFPGLLLLLVWIRLLQDGRATETGQTAFINVMFLGFQFLILSAYFSVKHKKWTNITAGLLGWGDVLFLLALCFYLSVLNFLFFYMISLLLVLALWLAWRFLTKTSNREIPLAGLQALLFAMFSAASWWIWPLNLTNDNWLLQVIYKWM